MLRKNSQGWLFLIDSRKKNSAHKNEKKQNNKFSKTERRKNKRIKKSTSKTLNDIDRFQWLFILMMNNNNLNEEKKNDKIPQINILLL